MSAGVVHCHWTANGTVWALISEHSTVGPFFLGPRAPSHHPLLPAHQPIRPRTGPPTRSPTHSLPPARLLYNACQPPPFRYLAQGTLRPDLIESASAMASAGGNAEAIKTHHNDTQLVRELRAKGRVVEPLKVFQITLGFILIVSPGLLSFVPLHACNDV